VTTLLLLQTEEMVGRSPEEVATFLAKTEGLDKTLIGDYLGEREDFNLKVMHAFVDALDFSLLEFDTAIRTFLQVRRLRFSSTASWRGGVGRSVWVWGGLCGVCWLVGWGLGWGLGCVWGAGCAGRSVLGSWAALRGSVCCRNTSAQSNTVSSH
jgi:hypothetical protein